MGKHAAHLLKTASQQRAEELRQAWLRPRSCEAQSYLRVRHLPLGITSEELFAFFRGYGTVPVDIRFFPGNSECLLQLPSVSNAQSLLAEHGKLFLFGCTLEVLPATEDESRALGFLSHARDLLQGTANRPHDVISPALPSTESLPGEMERPPTLNAPPAAARNAPRIHSRRTRSPFRSNGTHQGFSSGNVQSSRLMQNTASTREIVHNDTFGNGEQHVRASSSAKSLSPPKDQHTFGRYLAKYSGHEQRVRSTSSTRSQHSRTRTTSPLPPTPRDVASSISPRGYSARRRSPASAFRVQRPPPLPHDPLAAHAKASIMLPRRAASAPPAVLGELPVPAQYWEYSAREWNVAVSPQKMESLRMQLASVRSQSVALRSSFEEDTCCCRTLEEEIEDGKIRLRDLREEETAAMNAEKGGKFKNSAIELEYNAEILAMRHKTEILASEVEAAAQLQLTRCGSLNEMRIAAKLARARQDVKASFAHYEQAQVDHSRQEVERSKAVEAAQQLRARIEEIQLGIHKIRDEECATRASVAEREAAQCDELATVRLEITEAINAKQLASNTLAAQHHVHEARRNSVSDLRIRLAETRVATQRLAKKLQEIGSQGSSTKLKLGEVRGKVKVVSGEVGAHEAACNMLAAELQQQRDATMAWQACADDLARGHLALSAETARVVNASREALCSMAVDIDKAGVWSGARLLMPTR